jgi:hypothetical protein
MLALNWGLAVLFPVLTMVCRPKPLKKGEKIRVGQFNMLVIVMGMAYGIAFLMIRFWQLNLWATMVFLGLPILYLLTIWLKAKVTPSTVLMSIPSAMVALLVLVSAVRQSMAVSMVLAVVIDIVLLVVIVYTFGKVGVFSAWINCLPSTPRRALLAAAPLAATMRSTIFGRKIR